MPPVSRSHLCGVCGSTSALNAQGRRPNVTDSTRGQSELYSKVEAVHEPHQHFRPLTCEVLRAQVGRVRLGGDLLLCELPAAHRLLERQVPNFDVLCFAQHLFCVLQTVPHWSQCAAESGRFCPGRWQTPELPSTQWRGGCSSIQETLDFAGFDFLHGFRTQGCLVRQWIHSLVSVPTCPLYPAVTLGACSDEDHRTIGFLREMTSGSTGSHLCLVSASLDVYRTFGNDWETTSCIYFARESGLLICTSRSHMENGRSSIAPCLAFCDTCLPKSVSVFCGSTADSAHMDRHIRQVIRPHHHHHHLSLLPSLPLLPLHPTSHLSPPTPHHTRPDQTTPHHTHTHFTEKIDEPFAKVSL